MRILIRLILFTLFYVSFSSICLANNVQSMNDSTFQSQTFQMAGKSEQPTINDIYDALIETKNDKITLLTNFVNWIIAIASIIVAVAIGSFGWFLKKIRLRYKELEIKTITAQTLINHLEKKSEDINHMHEEINTVLSSKEYSEKISYLEEKLSQIDSKLLSYDQLLTTINNKFSEYRYKEMDLNIRKILTHINSNFINQLTDDDRDTFISIITLLENNLHSISQLEETEKTVLNLYKKYKSPTDEVFTDLLFKYGL